MIVYVWPRVHQNICDELDLLKKKGTYVEIFCLKKTKKDKLYSVKLVKYNKILTRLATKILGEIPNNGYAIPSISTVVDLKNSIQSADIVCLREGRFPVTLISLYFSYIYGKTVHFRVQVKDLSKLTNIMKVRNLFLRKGIEFEVGNNLPIVNDIVSFRPFIVSPNSASEQSTVDPEHLTIITVGKLEHRKNLPVTILVGAKIASLYPRSPLTIEIVYSWKNQESAVILDQLNAFKIKYEVKHPNLKINFYDEIRNEAVRVLMSQSAVYLHPADDEPASYSVIEAYAMGCFVICKSDCLTSKYLPPSDHATIDTIDVDQICSVVEIKLPIIVDQKIRNERINKITTICYEIL